MAAKSQYVYNDAETEVVSKFVESLEENAISQKGTFDSASANDFLSGAINQNNVEVPKVLGELFEEVDDRSKVVKAILDGIKDYRAAHGCDPTADLLRQAMHNGWATTEAARKRYRLDAATSAHHDQWSLQPNRAVVAILPTITEAIPFAHYLPADIGSNEAILAIMSHNAGGAYGQYAADALMDGVASGNAYISSSRVHTANPIADGTVSGKLTTIQATDQTCDTAATGVKLLRGRTLVYVNGIPVAKEVDSTGTGNSTISGSVTIGATTYQIGGTINTDTGVIALTTTPALPITVPVTVEGFIDYERDASITPRIVTQVNTYRLYAKPWRVTTDATIDTRTQMANELGLDPYSEGIIAIQNQYANERHYDVLLKARRLSANNSLTYDFAWATRSAQMNRAAIWQDFSNPLGQISQQMAIDTMNHGVTHLYVGKNVMANLLALPSNIFEPSGIAERPGIFRVGRLFGRYEVYYTPKVITETATSSQILCIGRATDVTRNPFVLGDAVAPTMIPLSTDTNMTQRNGFYARNFTAVNPHGPSALGCAMITVNNLA